MFNGDFLFGWVSLPHLMKSCPYFASFRVAHEDHPPEPGPLHRSTNG